MSFMIQYTCPHCGYKTTEGELIDPLGMPNLFICSCKDCSAMFHRRMDENGKPIDQCPVCGSHNITVREHLNRITCPKCEKEELNVECIGTCF